MSTPFDVRSKVKVAYEFQDLRHLDLREDTARLILTQLGGIADGKCVRPLDCYFEGFAAVQLSHALYLAECDEVSIFETMKRFIRASDETVLVLKMVQIRDRKIGIFVHTLVTETINPVSACSPVVSTQVN